MKRPSPASGDKIRFDGAQAPHISDRFIFQIRQRLLVSPPTERCSLSSIGFVGEDVLDRKNSKGTSKRRPAPRSELTPPTTCKLALGAAMCGRRCVVFWLKLPVALHSQSREGKTNRCQKNLNYRTERRGGPRRSAGKLGITLNFPSRSARYPKMSLESANRRRRQRQGFPESVLPAGWLGPTWQSSPE